MVEQSPPAVADASRQAVQICVDVDTLPVEVPEDFPGVFFSSALSEDVPGSIDLVLLTNMGLQSVPLPDPLTAHMQMNELTIQSVSPDGRLVSFRPLIFRPAFPEPTPLPNTPFYIWDLQTNEVAIMPLVEQDVELFIGRTRDQRGFARWADSSTLVLHYITQTVEEGTGIITRSVEISTNPLAITLGFSRFQYRQ